MLGAAQAIRQRGLTVVDIVAALDECGYFHEAERTVAWCGATLWTRGYLRMPQLAPLADDPRIQALRAESERILARARWR